MCLMLYASIQNEKNVVPIPTDSPYLKVARVTESSDTYHILPLFGNMPVWLVTSEEGCSCKFYVDDPPAEDWPEELLVEAKEDYEISLVRREKLRDFCGSLASSSNNGEVSLFGYWIGDPIKVMRTVEENLVNFFNAHTMFLENGCIYRLWP